MRNPIRIVGNRVMKIMGNPHIKTLEEEGMRDKVLAYSAAKKNIVNQGKDYNRYERLAAKNRLTEQEYAEMGAMHEKLKQDLSSFSGAHWGGLTVKTDAEGRQHRILPILKRNPATMDEATFNKNKSMMAAYYRDTYDPLVDAHKKELIYGAGTTVAAGGGAGALGLLALAAMRKKRQVAESAAKGKRLLGIGAGIGLGGAAAYGYANS